jgi:hypothetical protein
MLITLEDHSNIKLRNLKGRAEISAEQAGNWIAKLQNLFQNSRLL